MKDVLQPTPQVLIKLGSLIVHYQELNSKHGHQFDQKAIDSIEIDEDVKEWIKGMNELALLPSKRN